MSPPSLSDLTPDLSTFWRAITEQAPLPVAAVEGPGHVVQYVNPAFSRLLGKTPEELTGRPFADFFPANDTCLALLDRVYQTGKSETHTESQHPQVDPLLWSYTIWPVVVGQETVGGIVQVIETAAFHKKTVAVNEALLLGAIRQHELTEATEDLNARLRDEIEDHKRTEEALRASEERYRGLFNSMDEGFCVIEVIFDPQQKPIDWRYLEANPSFEKHSGMRDVTGKRATELIPEIEDQWFTLYGRVALTGVPERFVGEVKVIDRWIDLYVFRFGDAAGRKVAVVFSDITERRRTQDKLAEKARLLDLSNDAIIVRDLDDNITSWNKGAEKFFGWTSDEVLGKSLHVLLQTEFPKPRAEIVAQLYRERDFTGEVVQVARDGRRIPSLCRWVLDMDTKSILTSYTDISARKVAELEMAEARQLAERANLAKDLFLAALSHELRTPLSPVLLLAGEAAADPTLPAEARETFATIVKNVKLEARLIDDLLDITRITHGKLTLDLAAVDVHVALRDAIETVQADMEDKRIGLTLNLTDKHALVLADPIRLQQIFWNIIRNAVKFSSTGGRIVIDTEVVADSLVRISVKDSGIGISPAELERLFTAFSQGDHAGVGGSHKFGGLGLGLSISRKLVELHAGRIHAESEGIGHGATFIIDLPVDQTAVSRADQPKKKPASKMSSAEEPAKLVPIRRILVVEDHDPTRGALEHLLTRRNYSVVAAASVTEARAAAAAQSFDLLISDLGLPDGSGLDLMAELRSNYGLTGIALTGFGRDEDVVRSRAAGFITHLIKPVSIHSLEAALAAAAVAK